MGQNPGEDTVYCDFTQRVTIAVEITSKAVKHLPLSIGEGFAFQSMSAPEFFKTYRPLLNYPLHRALGIYANYMKYCLVTPAVMDYIRGLLPGLNVEESKPVEPTKPKRIDPPKKSVKARDTISSRFKELIMQGELTDEEMFERVSKECGGLPEDKRNYPSVYRSWLKNHGYNPPKQIRTKK